MSSPSTPSPTHPRRSSIDSTVDSILHTQPALQRNTSHTNEQSLQSDKDIVEYFERSVVVQGIVHRRFEWHELYALVSHNRLDLLARLQSQIDQYMKFRNAMLHTVKSMADHIIHKKFGARYTHDEDDDDENSHAADKRNYVIIDDLFDATRQWPPTERLPNHVYYRSKSHIINTDGTSFEQAVPIVVCPNDFPYALAAGIYHYIIWCPVQCDQLTIEAIISQEFPCSDGWETMQFVNPPELQTVKNLWHAHIFAKKANHENASVSDDNKTHVQRHKHPIAANIKHVTESLMASNLQKCS